MSKKNTTSAKTARERMRAEREKQAAAQKRRDRMLQLGIAIAVVIVLVAVAGVVQWQRSQAGGDVPANLTTIKNNKAQDSGDAGNGDPVSGPGETDAPVLVEVFEDFMCPHCATFENSANDYMAQHSDSGNIKVVYYPVTLDSFGEPSENAANAYVCAANEDPEKAQKFHDKLYEQQQEWTSDTLIKLGEETGLSSGSFSSCVNGGNYTSYLNSIDKEFGSRAENGQIGTPAVYVNGKKIEGQAGAELGVAELQTAVNEALKK